MVFFFRAWRPRDLIVFLDRPSVHRPAGQPTISRFLFPSLLTKIPFPFEDLKNTSFATGTLVLAQGGPENSSRALQKNKSQREDPWRVGIWGG